MAAPFARDVYSRRHHFLPVFYLKGFTGPQETFHVYDKLEDRILESQSPKSKYFEKHLNNYKFDGEIKFTLEESYFTPVDSTAAPLFLKIREDSFNENTLTALDKFQILHFLMVLFWRLPGSNEKTKELIKKEGVSNRYLGMFDYDRQLNDEEVADIAEKFLQDEMYVSLYKSVIPMLEGPRLEIFNLFDKWNVFTLPAGMQPLVTGDAPLLIKNDNFNLDHILGELIFPLSHNRLLILSDKVPKFLDFSLNKVVNLAILDQSKRYISCQHLGYLQYLIDEFKKIKSIGADGRGLKVVFDHLHYQAGFNSHREYMDRNKN